MSYVSELTQFLRVLHDKNPKLFLEQKQARQVWWDCPNHETKEKKSPENQVPQKPYPYYQYFFKK